jgi:hypothetical protein
LGARLRSSCDHAEPARSVWAGSDADVKRLRRRGPQVGIRWSPPPTPERGSIGSCSSTASASKVGGRGGSIGMRGAGRCRMIARNILSDNQQPQHQRLCQMDVRCRPPVGQRIAWGWPGPVALSVPVLKRNDLETLLGEQAEHDRRQLARGNLLHAIVGAGLHGVADHHRSRADLSTAESGFFFFQMVVPLPSIQMFGN